MNLNTISLPWRPARPICRWCKCTMYTLHCLYSPKGIQSHTTRRPSSTIEVYGLPNSDTKPWEVPYLPWDVPTYLPTYLPWDVPTYLPTFRTSSFAILLFKTSLGWQPHNHHLIKTNHILYPCSFFFFWWIFTTWLEIKGRCGRYKGIFIFIFFPQ